MRRKRASFLWLFKHMTRLACAVTLMTVVEGEL
jgi:hypothetical protein